METKVKGKGHGNGKSFDEFSAFKKRETQTAFLFFTTHQIQLKRKYHPLNTGLFWFYDKVCIMIPCKYKYKKRNKR
jgi:hypothetical protein